MIRLITLLFLLCGPSLAMSQEEEKQPVRSVSELKVQTAETKTTLKTFMEQADKRPEQIGKRFEQNGRSVAERAADEALEGFESGKSGYMLKVLRELAKEDERHADVLRKYNLL